MQRGMIAVQEIYGKMRRRGHKRNIIGNRGKVLPSGAVLVPLAMGNLVNSGQMSPIMSKHFFMLALLNTDLKVRSALMGGLWGAVFEPY